MPGFLLPPHEVDGDSWTEGFARILSDHSDVVLSEAWRRLATEVEIKVLPDQLTCVPS